MPARARIVRSCPRVLERKTLSIIVIVASVSTILLAALDAANNASGRQWSRDSRRYDHLPRYFVRGLLLIALFDFLSGITCAAAKSGELVVGSALR